MGEEVVRNKKVVLRHYVSGFPKESDFEVVTTETVRLMVPEGSGAVLVKSLYLSCDPFMRSRMSRREDLNFYPEFTPGSVISGIGVARVVDPGNSDFSRGELVWGAIGWEEYSLIENPESLVKIRHEDLPLSYYAGLIGMTGFSASVGFYDICSPKKEQYVFVSAASGAVGQLVGQFAKLTGCYVVGSAGSDEKVGLLKGKLGFDDAFNYKKESDLNATLKRYFPEGIDIYFDNVGGRTLEAVLPNMRTSGRISACGMISQYNLQEPECIHNLFHLITKCVRIEGFMAHRHLHKYPEFEDKMAGLIKEGKIVYMEDVAEGIDSAPAAFVNLFTGRNFGKQLVLVARD
ncbi:unnamed protein product [Spirodela intermedia]|uniref:Uncharacterized protein n=1 Tax=Spirodela intermedia TaxID=51605 RepID=A0A7I8KFY6_SPIIN|nr:unnamed protein product [Spirodela intermedia]